MKTLISVLFAAWLLAAPARADITIAPLRQVLDEDRREVSFTLSNPSDRILSGRASWIDMAATPDGYAPADAETRASLSAAPFLTLSPAQFRLEPGGRIEIRVSLRDGAKPPVGERRSHLLIETSSTRALMHRTGSDGLHVDIGAGLSVPVMVRGDGHAKAALTDTKLLRGDDGKLLLATFVASQGAHSSFGRLTAEFRSADDDETQLLSALQNVTGYPDAEYRRFTLPLDHYTLGDGTLTLRYEGTSEYEGEIFDTRSFQIAPPE